MNGTESEKAPAYEIMALGLSGVEFIVSFGDPTALIKAANYLMNCHPHHFAVLPDNHFALAVSKHGALCLKTAVKNGKLSL